MSHCFSDSAASELRLPVFILQPDATATDSTFQRKWFELQKILERQRSKGGIIDPEEESNRFLIHINEVRTSQGHPEVTEGSLHSRFWFLAKLWVQVQGQEVRRRSTCPDVWLEKLKVYRTPSLSQGCVCLMKYNKICRAAIRQFWLNFLQPFSYTF